LRSAKVRESEMIFIHDGKNYKEDTPMKPVVGEEMKELKKKLELLRKERNGGRAPLPQKIWDEAVQIAQAEGIGVTAKSLHLNYTDLKIRIEQTRANLAKKESNAAFIQLPMPALDTNKSPARKVVIELSGRHGDRMRFEAEDAASIDIMGLAQTFWSRSA
jgi:hypothetical protein